MSLFVDIEKKLGDFYLNVRFEAEKGILSLLGASGAGKTVTLKCIAGIEKPDKGKIILDGRVLFDSEKKINLPPQKRKIGYLFQDYALFPHMTVEQNIRTGLRKKDPELLRQAIKALGLEQVKHLHPHQLSGGQKQRVALARILVNKPDVLLLDEPFAALDEHLRFRLEQELRRLLAAYGKPVLLVSHNKDEVYRLSDRTAILHNGTLQTTGKTKDVFRHPQTEAGARLVGYENISPIRKVEEYRLLAELWGIELETAEPVGDARFVGIRSLNPEGTENRLSFRITDIWENPGSTMVFLQTDEEKDPLLWETKKGLTEKDHLTISVPKDDLLLLR